MGGVKCNTCKRSVNRYDDYLVCTAYCGCWFHIACIGVTVEQLTEWKLTGAAKLWKCGGCPSSPPRQRSLSVDCTVPGAAAVSIFDPLSTGVSSSESKPAAVGKSAVASKSAAVSEPAAAATTMSVCFLCQEAINIRKRVRCGGCERACHPACIHETADLGNLLSEVRGLSWKCDDCVVGCIAVNQAELRKLVEDRVQNALATLTSTFELLKADFIKLTQEKFNPVQRSAQPPKYSDVVNNKAQPAVLIKPKNQSQSNAKTKQDMLENINPVDSQIQLSKVKHINHGGILVGCVSQEDREKLRSLAQQKLSGAYDIQELKGVQPRVRVVGFSDSYDEQSLLSILRKMNTSLFYDNSFCNVIKISKTKKNSNLFQAVLQLDRETYGRVMMVGNLFVGYDSCAVFDAIDIYRCFNCNAFHHSAKNCTGSRCCPRCGEDHSVKECKAEQLCCSNCKKLKSSNRRQYETLRTDHAAWDVVRCTAYNNMRSKLRDDILAQ